MSPCPKGTALLDAALRRALFEASWEAVFVTNSNGIVKMMNRAAEQLFGYPSHDVLGQSLDVLIAKSHVIESQKGLYTHLETSKSGVAHTYRQMEGLRRDGRRFPIHISMVDFEVEGKQGFIHIVHDVTWERQLNDQLHQIVAVFEHTNVGLMITDPHGKIEAINSAFTNLTGYRPDEVVGRHSRLLKSGRHEAPYYATVWQAIHDTGAWRGEMWNRGKNAQIHAVWLSISALRNRDNEVEHLLAVYTDITPLKNSEEHLDYLAHHDPLTGLANRLLLSARFEQALRRQPRRGGSVALLLLDLNRFKEVNDTFGHDSGNKLLADVSRRLTGAVRQEDTVARLGGDEFAILLEQLSTPSDAGFVAEQILSAMSYSFSVRGQELHVGASIGISLFPADGRTIDDLLRSADRAMYQAKQQAQKCYGAFEFASNPGSVGCNLASAETDSFAQSASPKNRAVSVPLTTSPAIQENLYHKGHRIARVHNRILTLVDELVTASGGCSVQELAESLPELFDLLMMHFADEERRGGPFDAFRKNSKDRHNEIDMLEKQHFQIMSEVATLVKLSRTSPEDEQTGADYQRFFSSTQELARTIKNHEQQERLLFQNSA